MSYAPGIAEFVERANSVLPPDYHTRPLAEQRRLYASLVEEFPFPRPAGVTVVDDTVTGNGRAVPVRVYRPARRTGRGAYLYMHGGGFVLGSLDTHDTIAAELADRSGLVVVAVDFRPSPEHPFPAAVEDCYAALCGVAAEADRLDIDPGLIGAAGDSSGANLAVAVCLVTRDRLGPPVRAQALISPVLDFARWQGGGEDAPLLSGDEMVLFTRQYTGDPANVLHRYVSPLRSARFDALPPAYIMAAEADSLRVDSLAYAERLRAHGTPVELVVEPGFVHACVRARGVSPAVAQAWERFCAAAATLLNGTPAAGAEPAGAEPAGAEPAGAEPAGAEPAGAEPAGAEPAGAEPAGAAPAGRAAP
jgi:acetyl esterase